ncbi:MAG: 50S ribosomal protein L21 [Planctomycetaceae bacterium]
MFAIIDQSGRQMRVSEGDILNIDFQAEAKEGQELTFGNVLLANGGAESVIGTPAIANASVTATVVNPLEKGPKIYIQKFRRRKNYRRRTGHRQKYTTVKITEISVPGLKVENQDA